MHHCVRAESVPEPAIEGDVVMRGHEFGAVVDGDGIFAEAAGRLYPYEHIAQTQARHEQVPVVSVHLARRLAPVSLHGISHISRNAVELRRVLVSGYTPLGVSHLLRREKVSVIGASLDETAHEFVTVVGYVFDPVTGFLHSIQKVDCGCRSVQPDSVAEPRCLSGVVTEDNGNLALGCGRVRHSSISGSQRRHRFGLLNVRHVPP